MRKEISVEEDIECQNLVNELYELLERYGLTSISVFDPTEKTLKEADSLAINGTALQVNAEPWNRDEDCDTLE